MNNKELIDKLLEIAEGISFGRHPEQASVIDTAIERIRKTNSYEKLLESAKLAEKWWLEQGMKDYNGAFAWVFSIRQAISESQSLSTDQTKITIDNPEYPRSLAISGSHARSILSSLGMESAESEYSPVASYWIAWDKGNREYLVLEENVIAENTSQNSWIRGFRQED